MKKKILKPRDADEYGPSERMPKYEQTSLENLIEQGFQFEPVDLDVALDQMRERANLIERLVGLVDKLDEPDRTIVRLWMRGYSLRQIAQEVNRNSAAMIRYRIKVIIRYLRIKMNVDAINPHK